MLATLMAVGNSTDSVSARLPGMFAPAAIGWSANVTGRLGGGPGPVGEAEQCQKAYNSSRPALRSAPGNGEYGLIGACLSQSGLVKVVCRNTWVLRRRLADAHAQPVHRRAGRCDRGVAVVRPTGRSSAGLDAKSRSKVMPAGGMHSPVDHVSDRDVRGGARDVVGDHDP